MYVGHLILDLRDYTLKIIKDADQIKEMNKTLQIFSDLLHSFIIVLCRETNIHSMESENLCAAMNEIGCLMDQ